MYRAFGAYPWTQGDEADALYQTIVIERNLEFVLKRWNRSNYVDEKMKDLLRRIFVIEEDERISTDEIIKHLHLS